MQITQTPSQTAVDIPPVIKTTSLNRASFNVVFEDASMSDISFASIESFTFISSLFKVFNGAKVVFKNLLRSSFNEIKTGMKAGIIFVSGDVEYVNRMAVYSFSKVPGDSLTDATEITFISAEYFEDKPDIAAYSGGIGNIVKQVITDKFPKVQRLNYSLTEDTNRYRYQTNELGLEYLKRISKYAVKKKKPVYLYHDMLGNFNFRAVADMIDSTPRYYATPVQSTYLNFKSANGETCIELPMGSYTVSNSGKSTISKMTSKFNTYLFKSTSNIPTELSSPGVETNNAQSKNPSPERVKFYDWSLTPDDAYSIAVRDTFEQTCNTYYIDATFSGLAVEQVEVGDVIYVILPYNPTASSSTGSETNGGEGKYLITDVTLSYANSVHSTTAHMVQVAY